MRPRPLPLLSLLMLLGGVSAQAQQKPQVDTPPAFSRGDTAKATGLEAAAWWQAFGDATLDRLISRAVRGSLTVQMAQARILQARAVLGSAKADQWPSATAKASVTRSESSLNTATPLVQGYGSRYSTLYDAGFSASWEVDLFGGKRKARQAAEARYEASVEDLNGALLTLIGDVANSYFTLRSDQAVMAITERDAETQGQTVQLTEARHRLGLSSALDVAQAKAQLASTASELPTLNASIQQSIHRISLLLGQEPGALREELSKAMPLPSGQALVVTGLPSELLSRRPDLRSAERTLAAAMADIGVAQADLYPKFDLTFGLGLQSSQTSNFGSISSRYGSIVPGLSLPIFNRGALKANVAKKQAIYEESLASFRASYHSALEDVENALSNYYGEKARHQNLEESLQQSLEASTLAKERYQRGLTNFLDVLTTQATVHTAQRSLSQSDAKLLTHLVSLHKALGGGWIAAPLAT